MGIGISIFLLAVGAVLAFAVNVAVPNANMAMIGLILMVVGGIGLLVSLAYAATQRGGHSETRYVEGDHRHPHPGH